MPTMDCGDKEVPKGFTGHCWTKWLSMTCDGVLCDYVDSVATCFPIGHEIETGIEGVLQII